MLPVTWPEFSDMHPFAPRAQTDGYVEMIASLNADLCKITGFDAVRCRRFEVLRCLHFTDTTRVHRTMPGVVSFSILGPFDAPRRHDRLHAT